MFGDGSLTFQEFAMGEPVPLATIHDAVLEFLRDRDDAVLFGAQAVNAYVDEARMTQDVDIVMMLRLQTERMHGSFVPSIREYFHFFGLDYGKLAAAKPDALIMHPGPMNRGVEIDTDVADDIDRSAIREQVEMGVAVRMACLEVLSRNIGNVPPV